MTKDPRSRNTFSSCVNRIMNEKQLLEQIECTRLNLSPAETSIRINNPELETKRVASNYDSPID